MNHPRGMTLLELVAVLTLLSVFSVVSAELFGSIMKVTKQAADLPRTDSRRTELLERMRADVWSSAELRTTRGREMILRYSGDRSVFWTLLPEDGKLRRIELRGTREQARELWDDSGGSLPLKIESFGPGVRLTWPQRAGDRGGEVDLYSQIVSLKGATK